MPAGNHVGTIMYTAPEIFRDSRLTKPGDVYAFGIMSKPCKCSPCWNTLLWQRDVPCAGLACPPQLTALSCKLDVRVRMLVYVKGFGCKAMSRKTQQTSHGELACHLCKVAPEMHVAVSQLLLIATALSACLNAGGWSRTVSVCVCLLWCRLIL